MKKQTLYAILLITALGAVLRAYHLGFQGICGDESFTLMVVQKPLHEILVWTLFNDCSPPIFYLFSHIGYVLSGFQDWGMRIPSLVCGILSIPAMYYLGEMYRRSESDSETVGILAASITALLYPLVYYSQFARSFSMVFFFSILFFWQYTKIHRTLPKRTDYLILGILGAAMFWTNLFAIIPAGVVAVSLFFTKPARNAVDTLVFVIAAALPLIPLFLSTQVTRSYQIYPGIAFFDMPAFIAIEFFNIGLFIIAPLIILGLWFTLKDPMSEPVLGIVLASVLIGSVAALFTPVVPRYFFPILPLLLVFASVGISEIVQKVCTISRPVVSLGILVMIGLSQYSALVTQYFVMKGTC